MSSLFSSEKPDLVSFSPRLSVRAWRWMMLPPAETARRSPRLAHRGGVGAPGWEAALGRAVAAQGPELSGRSLGM